MTATAHPRAVQSLRRKLRRLIDLIDRRESVDDTLFEFSNTHQPEELSMTVKVGDVSDVDAITKVLQIYMNSAKNGKGSDMKPAFGDKATIFGYVGSELAFNGPIQSLFDWHDKNGSAKDVQARITNIDVVGTVAHARVEAENWTGYKFTDLFLLIKLDGGWKIINKVFHLH